MKRNIWRNKKGQIQGVDFALSMIIFLIIFAEVIVLSLNFLEPKYQNLDSRAFESSANQISEAFFASTGYPNDWEYKYSTQFNSFGLREIGTTSLDANKISRINPQALYSLSYQNLKRNLSLEDDIGFQLNLESLFDVSSILTLSQPTGSINITTSLSDCIVWSFLVAPNNTVIFTQKSQTDTSGDLDLSFPTGVAVLPDGYYTLVVFAQSQTGIYAIDYQEVIIGTETNFGLQFIVQENVLNNGLANIQTSFVGTLTSLSTIILYPYTEGNEQYGNESVVISSPSTSETFDLRIPTNGTCVAIVTADSITGFQRKSFLYPSQLSEKFGTIYGSDLMPENKQIVKIEKIVVIRECLFKAVLYVWPQFLR
ncbi:MAG: hypothetical protein KGD59_09585 [Candidatus Heimdallarchaeota archaeon]|nr:hypothetical protein [Candidatus Heimdallarchaeota archaeon]MBY8994786.1 hypothetical protein [Candidatus Heimdallarchaeota archaeon]